MVVFERQNAHNQPLTADASGPFLSSRSFRHPVAWQQREGWMQRVDFLLDEVMGDVSLKKLQKTRGLLGGSPHLVSS